MSLNPGKPINLETFLFGVMTGVAVVASVQYLVSLSNGTGINAGNRGRDAVPVSQQPPSIFNSQGNLNVNGNSSPPASGSVLFALEEQLTISSSKLQKIVIHMVSEFKKGLQLDGEALKMLPSYVTKRPTGNEVGTILALDLGGTNFRVCKVALEGFGKIRMANAKFTISEEMKGATGVVLFDFFAECVANFCRDQGIDVLLVAGEGKGKKEAVPMGFTFSFPVNQTSLNGGTLVKWTKGFSCSGVEGKDVVALLEEAFTRRGLNIKITALVNDTVGTLIAHAYSDPQTYISVILGTGTNAAYVEKLDNIKKFKAVPSKKGVEDKGGEMIVNTEWGNYGEPSILPISKWDQKLDRHSSNPKKQVFEKMISGMYLGEVVRLIVLDLVKSGELFGGRGSVGMEKYDSFETAYMARCERDHSLQLSDIKQLLEDVFQVPSTTLDDRRILKHVCELVGTRAARLSAAGIAALVTKINRLDGCTVAIDGSVYEHYPHFGNRMRDALHELLGITAQNIVLEQARDGSGQGAALIAALH